MTVPSNESLLHDTSNSTVNFTFDVVTDPTDPNFFWQMGNGTYQNWTYNSTDNFTHTTNNWQQTLDNFQMGTFCSDPMFISQYLVEFDWCSYNGSYEPWNWVNSTLRKDYLETNYTGNGTRFTYNLTSLSNVTRVRLENSNAMYDNGRDMFEMNSVKALAMATWDAIVQGHFSEPLMMWFTKPYGEAYYSYTLNLTNSNTTAHEIDFTI